MFSRGPVVARHQQGGIEQLPSVAGVEPVHGNLDRLGISYPFSMIRHPKFFALRLQAIKGSERYLNTRHLRFAARIHTFGHHFIYPKRSLIQKRGVLGETERKPPLRIGLRSSFCQQDFGGLLPRGHTITENGEGTRIRVGGFENRIVHAGLAQTLPA